MSSNNFAKVDLSTAGRLTDQLNRVGINKESVLRYLEDSPVEWSARRLLPDKLGGEVHAIPDLMFNDGEWSWHNELPYYVRYHDAQIPEALLNWMVTCSFQPKETDNQEGSAPSSDEEE